MAYLQEKLNWIKTMIKKIMVDNAILNWNPVDKAILVLALGVLDQILWIVWCTYSYLHPVLQLWLNHQYIPLHLCIMIINVLVLLLLFTHGCFNKKNKYVQKYFTLISVFYFALSFVYGGYSVGVASPATVAGYISLFSVGIVLFERKVIYTVFFPITLFLLAIILLTTHGYITDAPIFSELLKNTRLSTNIFWAYSMLYFYLPIFFVSIVLFEMLLSQWRNREKIFNEMSQIDPLTGIFNRRSISSNLQNVQLERRAYAVVLLDLDHFKKINDQYGHDIGDLVLTSVAAVLKDKIRGKEDIVGRFGGEEFILVLKEKELNYVLEVAERCRKEIEKLKISINAEQFLQITASFGVAMSAEHLTKEQVIKLSDQALYQAKQNGRNQVQYLLNVEITK